MAKKLSSSLSVVFKIFSMEIDYPKTSPVHADLKVTVQRFTKIFPVEKSEGKFMYLSNIDLLANFNSGLIMVFDGHPELSPQMLTEILENAAQKVLKVYDFFAGRLKPDPQSGRLSIECNSGWIGFAVASSELPLSELENFDNPARGLAVRLDEISSPEDRPLFSFQVTSFKCGGFAFGISYNHILFDGLSLKALLVTLASVILGDKSMSSPPNSNSRLLAARSPPQVSFPHREFLEVSTTEGEGTNHMKIFQNMSGNLENKTLKLSEEDIARLKLKAMSDTTLKDITSFEVIMAHLWRCRVLAENMGNDHKEKASTILYAVDIRRRLNPPLPVSYVGNALICAYATASLGDLQEKPFQYLVELISKGIERITDEYIRSHIDWLELHSGFPHGDIFVSSWLNIAGASDVAYPWGQLRYIFPLSRSRKDLVLLLPQIDSKGVIGKGVNVFVDLPSDEMKKFQKLFNSS